MLLIKLSLLNFFGSFLFALSISIHLRRGDDDKFSLLFAVAFEEGDKRAVEIFGGAINIESIIALHKRRYKTAYREDNKKEAKRL